MAYGVRSPDPTNGPVNTPVAVLASALRGRAPELAGQLAGRIIMQVDSYAEGGPVPREDLYESCRDNIEFMFGYLGDLGPRDLSAPRRTGRRRAEQGAPIAAVLSSFRIGFAFIWECVVTEARQSGTLSDAELVQIASDVWALHEAFTMEMMTAYRDELTKQALQRDRERSALVEALLEGPLADTATVWEAADLLGLPYQGLFAVVAAETTALARQPLPNIENRLRARDIGSAWRLLPDLQVGIVSLRSAETIEPVATMLRSAATARIGVSPAYTGLEKTPQALHLARVALASSVPGSVEVCVFDDAPLAVLVASSPATSYRIAERVLGPLLQIPPDEREMLLDTLETYFAARGSAIEAGKRLYCHPNTVRHRLHRIERQTGRLLQDPRSCVELLVALEALRRLPEPAGGSA
jgi:PucR C-terminal helix-turn-helix domain/GGDEF-like domain